MFKMSTKMPFIVRFRFGDFAYYPGNTYAMSSNNKNIATCRVATLSIAYLYGVHAKKSTSELIASECDNVNVTNLFVDTITMIF